jgi:hypothetical protein
MHALLFANQPKFDATDIDGYAKSLGLDLARFHADAAAQATTERLIKDRELAKAVKIDGLPSIWIDGRAFFTFEDLEPRIAFELSRPSASASKGATAKAGAKASTP